MWRDNTNVIVPFVTAGLLDSDDCPCRLDGIDHLVVTTPLGVHEVGPDSLSDIDYPDVSNGCGSQAVLDVADIWDLLTCLHDTGELDQVKVDVLERGRRRAKVT